MRITDKMRLNFLLDSGRLTERPFNWTMTLPLLEGDARLTCRQAIDAAILSSRKRKEGR